MTITMIGLGYQTAPIELRERLSLAGQALRGALQGICRLATVPGMPRLSAPLVTEAVILSTCNRFEVYASTRHGVDGVALLEHFVSTLQDAPGTELKEHLHSHRGDEVVQHLMRVACGLDSMILGEAQILGQVAQALEEARAAGAAHSVLTHLFTQAIHAGKRARTESEIGRHQTSVSQTAVTLLMGRLESRQNPRVLIVGAGKMAALAAQALGRSGAGELTFVNRTESRARALAAEFGGDAAGWHELGKALAWADGVLCATGAPHAVICQGDVEAVLSARAGRPLVVADIAVPRDVEATVRMLPGIRYFDVDDLRDVVDANLDMRRAAIPQVEGIIGEETARFAEWHRGLQVTPVITEMREWARGVASDELAKALNRLPDADEHTREMVQRMAHRLVNRLLHEPTTRLRLQAAQGNGEGYAHAVRELFALPDRKVLE